MIHFPLRTGLCVLGTSSILMLAACGQKGPLTMPSTPPPAAPDATLTTPPTVSPAPTIPTPKTP
ncbi:lipoprotein [Alcaligenaceae bacterium CGII-47]|nr:lipoprotein [Alcaligenaceae bacterium CGII-47]